MTIATFSLPIDIPWQRIAFSEDMIDKVACDRELPLRWRSSVAVFNYEPPIDQQRTDGFLVSYLKVSCTITGFQPRGSEIRIREKLLRSGWSNADLSDRLGEAAAKYYACNGAILEVVVAPHQDDKRFTLDDYPYFADFDPKKRELYEVVTETGEVMSRSLEDIGVRIGQTSLQSHEVRDKTTLGAGLAASYMGVSASGAVSNESGTTDLSTHGTENIRTSDAQREARETFSHTTQLSQMYHQLDSYHVGTNRAAFFVLPRPHVVQSPYTFVNGPREIEGIQEFMLVVVRPTAMEEFCVEAYLETAHLTGKPRYNFGDTKVVLPFKLTAPDVGRIKDFKSSTSQSGYVVDTKKGPQGVALGGLPHGDTGGFEIISVTENGVPRKEGSILSDYKVVVGADAITIVGEAEANWEGRGENRRVTPTTLEIEAIVYLKKKVADFDGLEPGLLITARAVCSCKRSFFSDRPFEGPSVVYEKALPDSAKEKLVERESMSILAANQLGADLKHEMLQSLSSADRYPRGTVGLLDSQLFAGMMGASIRNAEPDVNPRVVDWVGVDKKVARRVTAHAPAITRSEVLEMPLAQQVETFGITFNEAVELRRSLADLAEPVGPPPVPERKQVAVPLLTGLLVLEAQRALAAAGLTMGAVTAVDSRLPANSIVGHRPAAGAVVDAETEVSVRVASGLSVRLPEVIGLGLMEAACRIRDAGLRSEPTVQGRPGPDMEVVAIEPAAGSLVTPNTSITLSLKRRSKTDRLDQG